MMSSTEKAIKITLTLNEEEARWLKGTLQNPLHGHDPSTEPEPDRSMRKKFWDALDGVDVP